MTQTATPAPTPSSSDISNCNPRAYAHRVRHAAALPPARCTRAAAPISYAATRGMGECILVPAWPARLLSGSKLQSPIYHLPGTQTRPRVCERPSVCPLRARALTRSSSEHPPVAKYARDSVHIWIQVQRGSEQMDHAVKRPSPRGAVALTVPCAVTADRLLFKLRRARNWSCGISPAGCNAVASYTVGCLRP
ncbi:hypothetical protein DENSPDRAFT_835619 [Dentipellis sp. KUC8613]|nr:hypothetical protein DENSPDRAFT_835619 [Dentipellis sp. KUC8613]